MRFAFLMLTGSLLLTAAPAFAWRDVTPEERASIEKAIATVGCKGGRFNFDDDDNRFEVYDTRCENGQKFEVYLDRSFQIIRKRPD